MATPGASSALSRTPYTSPHNLMPSSPTRPVPTISNTDASPISSSSRLQEAQVQEIQAAPLSSRPRSPPRFVAALRPPSPPQQEICEKVRDAFEDLELDGISLPDARRAGQSGTRARSRSRERSRGRQLERGDRTVRDEEWDEKLVLSAKYGDMQSVPGPSNARQLVPVQQSGLNMVEGPQRSSSLSSASFTRPPFTAPVSGPSFQAPGVPPPPYSTLSSLSTASVSSYPTNYSSYSSSVRRMLLVERIRPWVPFLLYAATSLSFVLAIAFWKEEVFGGLDDLARWLRAEEEKGYAVMFFMIFLTCIPPLPLYSTLQVLSGYTFGAWTGCIISYFAALTGALFVFSLSRSVPSLRSAISSCMAHSRALQRVVRAVSRRPSLLFLVRLAPYPYNVLNALLAGCPRLTFRTYAACTALSLLKVIIHTSVGAGIKSFADYHVPAKTGDASEGENVDTDDTSFLSQTSTIAGIVLCLVLAFYLSFVARRAVDEELEDDIANVDVECGRARSRARDAYGVRADEEERAAFLDDAANGAGLGADFASARTTMPGRGGMDEEMVERERDGSMRLGASSPVPLSSLSATPYGPPEWSR